MVTNVMVTIFVGVGIVVVVHFSCIVVAFSSSSFPACYKDSSSTYKEVGMIKMLLLAGNSKIHTIV